MADFDPAPRLNPMAKGLLSAFLILGIALVLFGLVVLATGLLVWGWQ